MSYKGKFTYRFQDSHSSSETNNRETNTLETEHSGDSAQSLK